MLLHHRNVLVGGGVEDDVRPLVGDEARDGIPARHIAQPRHDLHRLIHPSLVELAMDVEQGAFGAVEEDEPLGPDRKDLPRELGPDGAASTRHEHGLASEDPLDLGDMLGGDGPAEQVLHLDRSHAIRIDTAIQQFHHGGDRPHGKALRLGPVHDPTDNSA